jgi:hypothetical protein
MAPAHSSTDPEPDSSRAVQEEEAGTHESDGKVKVTQAAKQVEQQEDSEEAEEEQPEEEEEETKLEIVVSCPHVCPSAPL